MRTTILTDSTPTNIQKGIEVTSMKLKYEFVITDMGDESVAVPVGDNADQFHGMIRLNESACKIMELLKEDTTVPAIVEALKKEYDSPEEEIQENTLKFLVRLIMEGVMEGWEPYFRFVKKNDAENNL